jgi:hypothetical protein
LSKYRQAYALGKNKDIVAKGLMELAFFYAETAHLAEAKNILRTLARLQGRRRPWIRSNKGLHKYLTKLDPQFYSSLRQRYYPEMVHLPTDSSAVQQADATPLLVSKGEITVWQYHLYSSSFDSLEMPPTPLWKNDGTLPVVDLSMEDIEGYLNWLSMKTNHTYRLPSAVEAPFISRDSVWLVKHRLSAFHSTTYDLSPEAIRQAGFHVCQVAGPPVRRGD